MKLSALRTDSVETEAVVASEPVAGDSSPAADAPWGVSESTTPNGTEIYFQKGPKRLYRVKQPFGQSGVRDDWFEVPSASEVLEVLEKGGLSWWGMKVGVAGALSLATEAALLDTWPGVDGPETLAMVDKLTKAKLTVNHVKGAAADRGTNVHTALELYADDGILPDPSLYPEHEAGYVAGLVAFLKDAKPEVEHSELMVASPTLGYAGRFDMIARLAGGRAVTKTYPKRSDIVDVVDPSWRFLLDLKTSKDVYESYHLQVAGYEGALIECGYEPVDKTAVVRVTKDGRYELVFGRAHPDDFAAVLDVYNIIRRIKGKA